ncbi:MBL fold metallo-hydrolase [Pseudanabaena sp. PCC 6802]|uniref:MBL fold metallo-hydrolase n=1 Tax=Pseudanabaena sp. PCC 6802 TaxID=118173 RepID=UPI00034535B9|nr:MBL fold metallo-hydrolase [Pseudanabaena sp. PCC 6802]
MAKLQQRRSQNVSGDLYVDSTCIDCDTCRWMAPEVFHRDGDRSAVFHQPQSEAERLKAMQALLSCPTSSIGTVEKPLDILTVQQSFPVHIAENVYHCGFHSESSYGAASYFIQRPEGNILVDSPRYAPPLVQRLESMGGIRYMYLTHRDDVADHQKFHDRFGCDRILHQDEIGAGTRNIEMPLMDTEPLQLAPDLLIITVPGHTKGHTVLLYKDKFLFSGDHLAWSARLNQLIAFRSANWYSWSATTESMKRLANYDFEWVLPGHGRRYHSDRATMRQEMQKCIAWMEVN